MRRKKEELFLNIPPEFDLEQLVREVLETNSKFVLEYRAGIMSSLEKLVSIVMKKSYGRADPRKVKLMIVSKI